MRDGEENDLKRKTDAPLAIEEERKKRLALPSLFLFRFDRSQRLHRARWELSTPGVEIRFRGKSPWEKDEKAFCPMEKNKQGESEADISAFSVPFSIEREEPGKLTKRQRVLERLELELKG